MEQPAEKSELDRSIDVVKSSVDFHMGKVAEHVDALNKIFALTGMSARLTISPKGAPDAR